MTLRLHLVRHGETALSGSGAIVGGLDVPLSPRGQAQARRAAEALAARPLAAVVTSPLRRAYATAAPIARAHGLAVKEDPGLRELDFGLAEGLTFEELERRFPAVAWAWVERPHEVRFPRGERLDDLVSRTLRAVQAIGRRHAQGEVAVVTHAGPIRVLLGLARGLAPAAALAMPCAYGAVVPIALVDGRLSADPGEAP